MSGAQAGLGASTFGLSSGGLGFGMATPTPAGGGLFGAGSMGAPATPFGAPATPFGGASSSSFGASSSSFGGKFFGQLFQIESILEAKKMSKQ